MTAASLTLSGWPAGNHFRDVGLESRPTMMMAYVLFNELIEEDGLNTCGICRSARSLNNLNEVAGYHHRSLCPNRCRHCDHFGVALSL